MKRYICDLCGYVYDSAEGDPDNGASQEPHLKMSLKIGQPPLWRSQRGLHPRLIDT